MACKFDANKNRVLFYEIRDELNLHFVHHVKKKAGAQRRNSTTTNTTMCIVTLRQHRMQFNFTSIQPHSTASLCNTTCTFFHAI